MESRALTPRDVILPLWVAAIALAWIAWSLSGAEKRDRFELVRTVDGATILLDRHAGVVCAKPWLTHDELDDMYPLCDGAFE